jgi:predicted N-acyltransferase
MEVVVGSSIQTFDRAEWNRLYPAELEDWNYYLAVERAALPGFSWLYFGVRENGQLRAAVPAFITDYRLDTTLTGPLRRFTDIIARAFPRLLRQRMLSLGSPVAEECHLGFAADADLPMQQRLLGAILDKVEEYTKQNRVGMIAVKDAAAAQDDIWTQITQRHRLRRQPGLPTAVLDVHFAGLDDYLRALGPGTRKDMRRKLRAGSMLRVEWRRDIADIREQIMHLYRLTLDNAALQFEELSPEYFSGVLRELGERASCVTYWLDDRLVAFNLVLHDERRLIDKFLGLDYAVAREYNLYFFTWMENVRFCIEHNLALYQSGQGLHREKLRLGSRLHANWLWYRHRNRVLDFFFSSVERVVRLDRHDPDLAALSREPRA